MPPEPLDAALRMQLEAAALGFDWSASEELWSKLAEEIAELRAADTPEHRSEELGDLLFMAVNLARHLGIDPAAALHAANAKFARRFAHVMRDPQALPPRGAPGRIEAMEKLWQDAKRLGY